MHQHLFSTLVLLSATVVAVAVRRTADDKDVARLKAAGATEVIPEVLESSLLIAAETLVQAGIPMKRAIQHVRSARAERYASLRDYYEAPKK